MSKLTTLVLAALAAAGPAAAGGLVVFDDFHAPSVGNSDWTIAGAYSDMADVLGAGGYQVAALSWLAPSLRFTPESLEDCAVVVLPEPNTPYSDGERRALADFVLGGGGLLAIADHGGSDRDFDGWDSARILDLALRPFGILVIGDTFSGTISGPAIDRASPVMAHVRRLGAWAATGLEILPEAAGSLSAAAAGGTGAPYVVAGRAGRGRVVAVGDSSIFDDGTGLPDKKLHPSFGSWLYDHRQFALNAVAYCAGDPPPPALERQGPPDASAASPARADRRRQVLLDIAHENDGVDGLSLFLAGAERDLGARVHAGFDPWTAPLLARFRLLLMVNPAGPLAPAEAAAAAKWLRRGGRLLLACSGARAPLNGIETANQMLEALGSGIRLAGDDLVDPESNAGQEWAVVTGPAPQRVIAWRPGSLATPDGAVLASGGRIRVLHRSGPGARRLGAGDRPEAAGLPDGFPLAAIEKIGRGRLLVLAAMHLSDYQYPAWERYPRSYRAIEHDTPAVNAELVRLLAR